MRALCVVLLTFLLFACSKSPETSDTSDVTREVEPSFYAEILSTAYTNCVRTRDNEVKCWGYGENYNFANGLNELIGDDPDELSSSKSTLQLGDQTVQFALANQYFGCALYDNNEVRCWGDKDYVGLEDPSAHTSDYVGDTPEELGNNLPIINFGDGLYATQLAVGDSHACVALNNGRVKCWGDGGDGKLGYGDDENIGDDAGEMGNALAYVDLGTDAEGSPLLAKSVSASYNASCAILTTDELKCWGDNSGAQLGYGDFEDRGDDALEMGDNLPVIDLGTGRTVKELFIYYVHSCAILDNDTLKCWGANHDGEIGLGTGATYVGDNLPKQVNQYCSTNTHSAVATQTTLPISNVDCPYGGIEVSQGLDNNPINGQLDPVEVSGTSLYCNVHDLNILTAIATIDPGDAFCSSGGLQVTSEFDKNNDGLMNNNASSYMGDNLPTIDFGSDSAVIDVLLGDDHTCALLEDGTLKCWGYNDYGQAGLGTDDSWGDGENETAANRTATVISTEHSVTEISGSYNFSCAVLSNDSIKCWGYDDDYATLGVPEYLDTTIGDSVDETGDNLQTVPIAF
jgi:alpha-tubulin suppressor-like RCC1 family protein